MTPIYMIFMTPNCIPNCIPNCTPNYTPNCTPNLILSHYLMRLFTFHGTI